MHSLTLVDVTVSHGAITVFDGVSLTIGAGSRIGVIGPNGAGKTTLLRLLAGLGRPERGTVRRNPPGLSVGYLPQELDALPGESLLAYLRRRTGVATAEAELEALAARLEDEPELAEEHAEALARFVALGGGDLEPRARTVCSALGVEGRLHQPLETFSGGEAARARLAVLLLARFDVFCLDEPTNDLDFDGLERLERFVSSVRASVVAVSHDRAFLDRMVTRIVELEEGTRGLRVWPGGWSEFEAARERAREAQYRRYEDSEARRRELEALLRERQGQARGGDELGERTGGADRRGTRALRTKVRQAERALERVEEVEKPFEPWRLRLELEPALRSGEVVARLEGAVVERGPFRLGPLDLDLRWGDRVALTGRNGSGKSTLLAALLGRVPLAAGRRTIGRGVVIGELDQRRTLFVDAEPLISTFPAEAGLPPQEARTLLAKFGLGADDVLRPARSLSPGERSRAALALLMARGVNCLVLDEPTNHLDLPAIEELETALDNYPGTVVLVTHDRRLLAQFRPMTSIELEAS
jgi:ATPase subunit of ABC transporter with duplicated ATPase domains